MSVSDPHAPLAPTAPSHGERLFPTLTRVQMAAGWPLTRPPYRLETSRVGVFAVGDVRSGNIKRVASDVGEGSIAVALVHQVLQSS